VHDETTLPVPSLNRLHDVPIGRGDLSTGRHVMYGSCQLIENEHGWPTMVVGGFLFFGCEDHLEYTKAIVFEEDLVIGRSRDHRIEARVPLGGIAMVDKFLFLDAVLYLHGSRVG
jgi:hypothetical protein